MAFADPPAKTPPPRPSMDSGLKAAVEEAETVNEQFDKLTADPETLRRLRHHARRHRTKSSGTFPAVTAPKTAARRPAAGGHR